MEALALEHVVKSYGGHRVLDDISISVDKGDFVTVIGRSGCGKTTLLKTVNGLVKPECGRVTVAGKDIAAQDEVALRRSIGYAIQSVGLFPHMSVEENIAYVPTISKLDGWTKRERGEKVASLLELVGLEAAIATRQPRELSGGQRQRVGIARALAGDPQLLLMDEPFGAVDEITRELLQEQILKIHESRGTTILFVTHDMAEAFRLATRCLVLDQGRVAQYDRPSRIISDPASAFVHEIVEKRRRLEPRA